MTNLEIVLYVIFGMAAGGPIWLLFLSETRRPRRQQWRVVDSVCKRLGVNHATDNQ